LQWGQVEVARMLIEHGADVDSPEQGRGDSITSGVARGQVEVARMLIEHGADVTAQDNDGEDSITSGVAKGQSGSRSHAY
jgi:ankyrin repeat protein